MQIAAEPTPARSADRRLPFVDGLRALCAVYVVVHHAYATVWPAPAGWPRWTLGWLGYSRFAVATFILLSGFSLALPAVAEGRLKRGAFDFYRRRVQRILPPFYLAMLLSIGIGLLIGESGPSALWGHASRLSRDGILANLFQVQDVWHIHAINPAFWSIAVECKIYLLFPLLVVLWQRMGLFSTAAVASMAGIALAFELVGSGLDGLTLHYLAIFCLGTCAAKWATDDVLSQTTRRRLIGIAAIALPLAIGVANIGESAWAPQKIVSDCAFVLAVAPVLVLATRQPWGWPARLLGGRNIAWIGAFSYSLYLTHMPLQQLIWQRLIAPLPIGTGGQFALLALLGTPALCGAAYVFYLICERPFIPVRRSRPSISAAPVPAPPAMAA